MRRWDTRRLSSTDETRHIATGCFFFFLKKKRNESPRYIGGNRKLVFSDSWLASLSSILSAFLLLFHCFGTRKEQFSGAFVRDNWPRGMKGTGFDPALAFFTNLHPEILTESLLLPPSYSKAPSWLCWQLLMSHKSTALVQKATGNMTRGVGAYEVGSSNRWL